MHRVREVINSRGVLLVSLIAGGLLNARSTLQMERRLDSGDTSQIVALSNALTILSVLVLFGQLWLLATVNSDSQVGQRHIPVFCAANSVVLGTMLILLVDAPFREEMELGVLVAAFSAVAHVFGLICAQLMNNRKWLAVALMSAISPVSRAVLSPFVNVEGSVSIYLYISVFLQVFACLVALWFREDLMHSQKLQSAFSGAFTPRLLAMYGFALFIGLSSLTIFLNESADRLRYEGSYFESRSVFMVGIVIATIYLPEIATANRVSRSSSIKLRKSTVLVTVTASAIGVLTFLFEWNDSEWFIYGTPSQAPGVTALIAAAWVVLAASLIPFLYLFVMQSRLTLAVLPGVAILIIASWIGESPDILASGLLVATGVLALSVLTPFFVRSKVRIHPTPVSQIPEASPSSGNVTVVVPSYNPGSAVAETVSSIYRAFASASSEISVIVVSDGSDDESVQILEDIRIPGFRHVRFSENRGKGAALREGFRLANSDYVAFIDADGDLSPDQLPGMIKLAQEQDADVVFGSKWHPSSDVYVSRARRLISRIHQLVQISLFDISISDSQVGIKVYRSELLRTLEPMLRETGFSLDIEIFVAAVAHDRKNFFEVPVKLSRERASTISAFTTLEVLLDLLRIFWRYRIELVYTPDRYYSQLEVANLRQTGAET